MTNNETDFQNWVQGLLARVGHVQDHRFSNLPHVPDLSAAAGGMDYWLELKYEKMRLGHDRYDDFKYHNATAGQKDWLKRRAEYGSAFCGFLGFLDTGPNVQYLCFMRPEMYECWQGWSVGAVILTPLCMVASPLLTGGRLLEFVRTASRCTTRPGTPAYRSTTP